MRAPWWPAIAGGLRDVFGGRLGGWALLCFLFASGATIAAAWAAFTYALPLIPDGQGWWRYLWTVASWLSGAGIVILAILMAPAISMIAGSMLFDFAAARVEKDVGLAAGRFVPPHEGFLNGLRIALPALVLNLVSLPLMFVPVVNIVWFLTLNGMLMGREYFSLTAVRRMDWAEARAMRRKYALSVFIVGLVCSFIPFVAPLVGASAMTRLVKAVS